MEKMTKSKMVLMTTSRIINLISSDLKSPRSKALLSNLRNSVGRPISENIGSLQIVYENMPEELLAKNFSMTKEECAILTTLQLFAIHQQSNVEPVSERIEGKWNNVGYSLKALRSDGSLSTDQRFNALVTSQTFEELTHHLRQMIKLLKSKKKGVKVDYPTLSLDLYNFLRGYDESVRLNWARAYYSYSKEENEKGEIENEQ